MRSPVFQFISRCSAIFAGLVIVGCTKGEPAIESVSAQAAISLNQSYFSSKNLSAFVLNLTGTCQKGVTGFEISGDGGNSWQSVAQAGSFTQDCDNAGTFSMTVPSLSQRVSGLNSLYNGEGRSVLVRGTNIFGATEPASVLIVSLASSYKTKGYLQQADRTISNHNYSNYTFQNTHNFSERTLSGGYKARGAVR